MVLEYSLVFVGLSDIVKYYRNKIMTDSGQIAAHRVSATLF